MKTSETPHCNSATLCKQCCQAFHLTLVGSAVAERCFRMFSVKSSVAAGSHWSGARTREAGWARLAFPSLSHTGSVQCERGVQEAVLSHRWDPKDPHWSLPLVSHKWLPIIPTHRQRCLLLTRGASGHFCRWLLSPAWARLPWPAVLKENSVQSSASFVS